MTKRWRVTVVYDQHGTETTLLSGDHVSVQLFTDAQPDGYGRRPAMVRVREAGQVVKRLHIAACYSIFAEEEMVDGNRSSAEWIVPG